MRPLKFANISIPLVPLLSSFVVVAIAGFIFFSGSTSLVRDAYAQQFDPGSGGGTPIKKQLPSKKVPTNSLKEYNADVTKAQETGDVNVTYLSGESVLPGIANGITCALTPCGSGAGSSGDLRVDTSLTGSMSNMIGYMFTSQPASSYIALADFMNSAGIPIAEPAYAQSPLGGLGFATLSPILETWKTFRNIAFLFFVIVILVIGFMIMFRQKVGQSAVTAQQAIPRVIIALLTVSFSYAIAGLLIDAMYILMTLMVFTFGLGEHESLFLGGNAIQLGIILVTSGAVESFEAIRALVNGIAPINLGVEFLAGWTVGLIVAIAIVFAMFRLFFELLKTYISIIISIAIAPMLLMIGAIPGKNVFGGWVKGLIGNLSAFPIVLLILILYEQLTGGVTSSTFALNSSDNQAIAQREFTSVADHFSDSGTIVPQVEAQELLRGGFSPPYLFGTIEPGGIAQFFIGMGLLLIMTDLVKQGKKALGADEGVFGQFATAFGDSLKKGWSGGELIPGLGITDTRKLPYGGLSAENITRKSAVTASATGSGISGAIRNPRNFVQGFRRGVRTGGANAASRFGEKQLYKEAREELEKKDKAH